MRSRNRELVTRKVNVDRMVLNKKAKEWKANCKKGNEQRSDVLRKTEIRIMVKGNQPILERTKAHTKKKKEENF